FSMLPLSSARYTLSLHDALPIYFQPGEELTQADTGGELRRQIALLLQLHAAFEQFADHLAVVFILEEGGDLVCDLGTDLGEELQDRKSTRLNSSHVKISYAVFCL